MTVKSTWRWPMPVVVIVALVRFIWIMIYALGIPVGYIFYLILIHPLMYLHQNLYQVLDGVIFRFMLRIGAYWMWTAGYTVAIMGEDVSDITDDEALVLCNHQSTADVPSLFYGFQHHGSTVDKTFWIMDAFLRYTNFGLVCTARGDFFIIQGNDKKNEQCDLLRDHLLKYYWSRNRKWIILFPEGGFLRKRRARSKEYARKHGFPILENVVLPRIQGMQTIMETLGPAPCKQNEDNYKDIVKKPLKWIIDITIGYPGACPLNFQTIMAGQRPPMETVHYYRKFPASEVPTDTEGLTKWMYDRFLEKEHILEEFYATGHFPEPSGTTTKRLIEKTKVEFGIPMFLALHIFFFILAIPPVYFMYYFSFWFIGLLLGVMLVKSLTLIPKLQMTPDTYKKEKVVN